MPPSKSPCKSWYWRSDVLVIKPAMFNFTWMFQRCLRAAPDETDFEFFICTAITLEHALGFAWPSFVVRDIATRSSSGFTRSRSLPLCLWAWLWCCHRRWTGALLWRSFRPSTRSHEKASGTVIFKGAVLLWSVSTLIDCNQRIEENNWITLEWARTWIVKSGYWHRGVFDSLQLKCFIDIIK